MNKITTFTGKFTCLACSHVPNREYHQQFMFEVIAHMVKSLLASGHFVNNLDLLVIFGP